LERFESLSSAVGFAERQHSQSPGALLFVCMAGYRRLMRLYQMWRGAVD
jgi:hypothetical protein